MNDFLTKPVVVEEITAALTIFLEQTTETTGKDE